jgi:hypothetical protein
MDNDMPESPNRRQIIKAGLAMSMGAFLLGCQRKTAAWKPLSPDQIDGPPLRPLAGTTHPRTIEAAPEVSPMSGIVSRREWTNAQPNMSLINPMNGVSRITVHHDGMPPVTLRSKAEVARRLEQIREAHVGRHDDGGRNWADIGYHYIVDPQGRVWEGRPVRFQGAHVHNNNEHNLGIMVLGNFDEQKPTPEALATLDAFLADRMRGCRVSLERVFTHQEINPTACPGSNLQAYMRATRSNTGRLARA